MDKKLIWLDCDTGVDDSLAILLACKLEQLEIVGASAVAGNTTLENAFRNTRNVFSLAQREDVKVYPGADEPIQGQLKTAAYVHGNTGLGAAILEDSKAPIESIKAYDAIYEKAKELDGNLSIIATGPLTNIALAINKYPDFVKYVKQLSIMGGAINGGNITPDAEFNIYVDAKAANIVFNSGLKINMFGLDVTHEAYIDDNEVLEMYNGQTKAFKLFKDSTSLLFENRRKFYRKGLCQHDSCPVVHMAYPEWFKSKRCGVYVETEGDKMGKTISDLDLEEKFENNNCEVFYDIDRIKFVKLINDICNSY